MGGGTLAPPRYGGEGVPPPPWGEGGGGGGRSQADTESATQSAIENPVSKIDNLPALGFFALGPVYYGDPKKLDQIDDRIDTLSRGLLGLTVACARCHDHKFDPISTRDYYSLAGVIASTEYVEVSLAPGKEGQPLPPKKAD